MAPRNATTPLSPLSPDPDQAPGLSRTPSFLEFAPKRAMASFDNLAALANYGERLREARKIVWCGRGERPVELQDQWECLEHGGRGGLGAGGLAFAIPSGVNLILRMTRIDNVPSVRARLGQICSHTRFVLNALPPSPGRGTPTPPARARSSATPFSTPRPLPRTLPSLTTPSRPRPVPLDGHADAPGVAVQANAAIILRARGRGCESLREARAADRDRAAGVEGETVLTVSPSPLPTVRDPCAAIPPTAHLIQPSTTRDSQPSQTQHVRKRRTASRADEFQRRAQTIRVQCQSAPVPSLAGR